MNRERSADVTNSQEVPNRALAYRIQNTPEAVLNSLSRNIQRTYNNGLRAFVPHTPLGASRG
jgi:hypothetical protein